MLRRTILLSALAAGLLLMPFLAGAAERDQSTIETMTLPALLQTIEEARGRVVLINYFATWCPPCKKEIPGLMAIRRDVPEEKLLLIGLSMDEDMRELQAYAQKARFNYPIWVADASVARWAGVSAIPHLVIFGQDGKLRVNDAGWVPEENLREFLHELLEQ